MKRSSDRILTTHVGSLIRPQPLQEFLRARQAGRPFDPDAYARCLAASVAEVVRQQATAGIIIASSIIVARALAPVELAVANWRGFVSARQSWRRLSDLLIGTDSGARPMALPPPKANLVVENVIGNPPGIQRIVVQDVSFTLKAGQGLGIIGPSASGKSSLARLIVGVWTPMRGKVRLDGAALDQWSPAELGPHIGYLPQDVELFAGTVAQNIARFEDPPDPNAIIAAAQAAGVHDLISNLPDGYDTEIGESGAALFFVEGAFSSCALRKSSSGV